MPLSHLQGDTMTFLAPPHRLISVCDLEKKGAGAAILQIAPKHRAADAERTDKERTMMLRQAELLALFMQRKVRLRRIQRQIAREEQSHIIILRLFVAHLERKLTLEEEKKGNLHKKVLTVSSTVAGRQNASKLKSRKRRKVPAAQVPTSGVRAISGWRRLQAGGRAAQTAKKFTVAGQAAGKAEMKPARQAAGKAEMKPASQAAGKAEMKPAAPVQRSNKKPAGKLGSPDDMGVKLGACANVPTDAMGTNAGARVRAATPAKQSMKAGRAPATHPNGQSQNGLRKANLPSDLKPPPSLSELPPPPVNRFRARQVTT